MSAGATTHTNRVSQTDPTASRAITRLGHLERVEYHWHCLDHSRNLTDKQARVFHPDCAIVSYHIDRILGGAA